MAEKLHFVASDAAEAQAVLPRLRERYGDKGPDDASVIVALGGDALPGPFFVAASEQNLPAESDRAAKAGLFYQWYERNAASGHVAASIKAAVCERS